METDWLLPQKKEKFVKQNVIEIAGEYINDSIHSRQSQKRIQYPGKLFITPLKAYQLSHNKIWLNILYIVIWIYVLSIQFELPIIISRPYIFMVCNFLLIRLYNKHKNSIDSTE